MTAKSVELQTSWSMALKNFTYTNQVNIVLENTHQQSCYLTIRHFHSHTSRNRINHPRTRCSSQRELRQRALCDLHQRIFFMRLDIVSVR